MCASYSGTGGQDGRTPAPPNTQPRPVRDSDSKQTVRGEDGRVLRGCCASVGAGVHTPGPPVNARLQPPLEKHSGEKRPPVLFRSQLLLHICALSTQGTEAGGLL